MEWTDDALVIGVRHHGETAAIADLITRERGRHTGYVHGGRSRRLRPVLQPGNRVRAHWTSRRDEGLGRLSLEPLAQRAAALMGSALALQATNHLCALLRLLPEREPHPLLYALADAILAHHDDAPGAGQALVRFELALLRDLGFGLDLARCAMTGETTDLAFVSPRTGRAVTRAAGEPYRDRVLALPAFLAEPADGFGPAATPADARALMEGFVLTGHFLRRDLFAPRNMPLPDARAAYLDALGRALGG